MVLSKFQENESWARSVPTTNQVTNNGPKVANKFQSLASKKEDPEMEIMGVVNDAMVETSLKTTSGEPKQRKNEIIEESTEEEWRWTLENEEDKTNLEEEEPNPTRNIWMQEVDLPVLIEKYGAKHITNLLEVELQFLQKELMWGKAKAILNISMSGTIN